MPEGCATIIPSSHATENPGPDFHAHSTLIMDVRPACALMSGRRAPGRARHVRGTCAAPLIAGHAPCVRVVSGRAQFMCATCEEVIGNGCEVTFTRLTCENSASYVPSGGSRCPYRSAAWPAYPPCQGGCSKSDMQQGAQLGDALFPIAG